MNSHSVSSHLWTAIPETGVSVRQESGSVQMVTVHDGEVELPRGGPWRVRSRVEPVGITSWKDKEFRVSGGSDA